MPASLTPAQWAEVRRHWEFDPDAPSFAVAASRAADAHGFKAPGRTAVHKHAHAEGWERRGSMAGINVAAHLRADGLVNAGNGHGPKKDGAEESVALAQLSNDEAVDTRAEVVVRHRKEWDVVGQLMNEALEKRHVDPADSFSRCKIAKITAETISLRQAGERKAWNLDVPEFTPADYARMTDEQLEAVIAGKNPRFY